MLNCVIFNLFPSQSQRVFTVKNNSKEKPKYLNVVTYSTLQCNKAKVENSLTFHYINNSGINDLKYSTFPFNDCTQNCSNDDTLAEEMMNYKWRMCCMTVLHNALNLSICK